jgi:two-component system sensor histidine kinase YesM
VMRFRYPFQFQSIHTSIAIAFSCLILCTTAILSYNSYRLSSDAVKDNSLEYTTQLIDQVNTNIQTYINNMESILALALTDGDLKTYVSMRDPNTVVGDLLANDVSQFFSSIIYSRNDIASIMFVGQNGALVSDQARTQTKPHTELKEQDWFKKAIEANGEVIISSSHVQHIYRNEYRWVVSISQQLPTSIGGIGGGVLLVDLNYNVITNLCQQIKLGKRGYVFILDPTGDMIYHPQQQIIYTQLKSEDIQMILNTNNSSLETVQGDQTKIYTIRTNLYGWKTVGVTYPDELVVNKREIQWTSALWGLLFLIIALAISVILSFRLTKPIKKLEAHMKKVEKGDFDTRADINTTNEIGKLSRSFNLMIGKIKDLMSQIVLEQEMKRISELKALQAQIQPHFLYNTLDSIIWMAETGKMAEVVKMTTALARLFRSGISKGEELVPISVELDHIENYLTIQKIRYRNKFTYTIDVDPSILDCKILKIVLQPLVENAIYHGIKHKVDVGHIHITGTRRGNVIELMVADDGVGVDLEKVKSLDSKSRISEGSNGIGHENIDHRIKLYFGEAYGLEFNSRIEEGSTVTLRFPELPGGD